ncbi:MAG: hypothetical protein JW860_14745 [Sedimentisphaerales bacterium]|nr:hypothetical protein [Sedimentisphaerales bacterium]
MGSIVPLIILLTMALPRYFFSLTFIEPFSWLVMGWRRFIIIAATAPIILITPLSRLSTTRLKLWVLLFMSITTIYYGIMPFAAPILIRNELEQLETCVKKDGVCIQQTGYTCGPAAAVTALKQMGIDAQEGQLAIWARTSRFAGTPEGVLYKTLQKHYESQGVICTYRPFKDIEELQDAGLTIVVIRYGVFIDHFITILEVRENDLVVADPLQGKTYLSHDEFRKKWRHSGIVLKRVPPG